METHVQMSGDFDQLDPSSRFEVQGELLDFVDREQARFRNVFLNAHLKRLHASLGSKPLLECALQLTTDVGRFNAVEEGFGGEAAIKSALLALRYQVDKRLDVLAENRVKVEGRKALGAES